MRFILVIVGMILIFISGFKTGQVEMGRNGGAFVGLDEFACEQKASSE